MKPPEYFNRIEAKAAGLWTQLKDPVLAGPWRQLFAQVQSPRHVLSELLQNADDAGAKTARVRISNDEFFFEHDGEDFNEEQFQSLCRFGYSNKRNLHTIGFRGVGFKSTFSLGSRVRIQTPTLDVVFDRDRFTLPVWNSNASATSLTRVSVRFSDKMKMKQLRMNLEEWASNPVSLLFFRSLLELSIESQTVRKEVIGRGPVARSEKIRLTGAKTEDLLLIRSAEEPFPAEVVNEISQERNADDLHLPPCAVEVVLGLGGKQRLFVVLPSGTDVDLPFSINAPFLQDPARQRIKEPEVSCCNRWLLDRAGRLAGDAMAAWLEKESLTLPGRSEAYRLLRGPIAEAADLTTSASKHVLDPMLSVLEDKPILLTVTGKLADIGECTALPSTLHEVWEPKDLTSVFAKKAKHLLSPTVVRLPRQVLESHGWIEIVSSEMALELLRGEPAIPKPATWSRLQVLWDWAERNIGYDWTGERRPSLRIVPVQSQSSLQRGKDVIRISSRGQQLSEADWNFISDFALAVDPEWIVHLNKIKSKGAEVQSVLAMLQELGLHEPSQVDRIAAQASARLLARGTMPVADCVRISQIFAALDAAVPEDFRYVTEDLKLRMVKDEAIIFDPDGEVEAIVPAEWAKSRILHSDYTQSFTSCSRERWFEWARSAKSKLHAFVPLTIQPKRITWRSEIEKFLASREGTNPKEYRYKNDRFIVDDYDFPPEVLLHWKAQAATNPKVWAAVVKGLLQDPLAKWDDTLDITVRQVSAQGTSSALNCGRVYPEWLIWLRSTPCLVDTHGTLRTPPELLLRTPETESLLGIEPFVAAELDDASGKKKLLRKLGVRDSAAGWEKVVDRLRALPKIKDPIRALADALRLYEALDRIYLRCVPADQAKLRAVFSNEALILSNSLEWLSSGELSLHADPDDDAPVVHSAIHSLGLWLRLSIPERPALEKSLEWLKTLSDGTRLDGPSYKRANIALARGGRRVWDDLGHWLSLDQTWEPVSSLRYRVSMRHLTRWEKLDFSTKRATADLRMLHGDMAEEAPFTLTQALADVITMRVSNVRQISGRPRRIVWLEPLADGLSRIKLSDATAMAKVREVARRLVNTTVQTVNLLEVTPCIDGTPVGEPLMPRVLWSETKLYLMDQSTVRLYRELKEELARPFSEPGVMDAVAHCIDRDAEFVREYLEAHFELDAQGELQPLKDQSTSIESPTDAEETQEEMEQEQGDDDLDSGNNGTTETGPIDEEDPGEEDEESSGEQTKREKRERPKEPSFMDRYAQSLGFRWHQGESCYTHANGAWIEKGQAPFTWQEHENGGGVSKRLFVAQESLTQGVEISYELWRLMEINPESIALILATEDGEPKEWSASKVQALKTAGQIHLHQSRFILKEVGI